MNRRSFIKTTAAGISSLAVAQPARAGANETLRVAVVGMSRGRALADAAVKSPSNAEVVALCDVDPRRFKNVIEMVTPHQKLTPKTYTDYRKMLEDKSIDVVAIATPDHWHVPLSLFSIQAGKDVYVEKPMSHTIAEGRLLVDFAKKHKKIVQHGTQSRGGVFIHDAIEYLRSGKLGKIRMAKAINSQLRGPIGRQPDGDPPAGVDYNLWLGPAAQRPFNPNRFHYEWHWHWDYGTGDMGNDGVHQIDVARWGLGVGAPKAVSCSAAQLFYDDDHETPDTQIATFEYDDSFLLYEMRLWTPYNSEGHDNGNLFYGDNSVLSIGRNGWNVTFKDGKPGPSGKETDKMTPHMANFIDCVRSRKAAALNASAEEGHLSSLLVHMGNISYKVGRRLKFDAKSETFINDAEADKHLTKSYRKEFAIPTLA
jgi:predicted dehydrogenase